jgi:hypothetical protein
VAITTINNTGTISANSIGIQNSYGIITTINNTGTISSSIGIYNFNTLTTLNNLQGASGSALTFSEALPNNYNIIINNNSDYGQLAVTDATGTMAFNIYGYTGQTLASGISASSLSNNNIYQNILTGLVGNLSNGIITGTRFSITGATGSYGGYSYALVADDNNVPGVWDLYFVLLGPTAADTFASMQPNASAMKNAFNSQYSVMAYGLNHDCKVFDANNVCVSVFGRNTSLNDSSYDNNAAGLILGYKPHAQFRIGTYIDQSLNSNTTAGVKVERSNPDVGVFGVWNMNEDGSGLELRAAANYGKRDLNVNRSVVGTSETGSGKSDLNAYGTLLEASYAYTINDSWTAKPYAGVRYLSIKRDGYTETTSADVQNPLSYSGLKQETASAVAGVRLNGRLAPKLVASLNAGFEHDLHHNIDDYRATGVDDLASINMNNQKDRTRPTTGLGISYDVADKQRLSANVQYRKEIFMSDSSVTGQVNYTIGF